MTRLKTSTHRLECLALSAMLLPAAAGAPGQSDMKSEPTNWTAAHKAMIRQIMRYGLTDERVLDAMRTVRRHAFIPESERVGDPYGDHPNPIGHGQTISQPYIVAYMTERIQVRPGEKVLEIGTGSGYQAAILAELGADVYTIEIVAPLAEHARRALEAEGYGRVHVRRGDGYQGWPEHAPFDAIIVTCAPDAVPPKLVEQLAEGGRMIVPVGEYGQRLVILRKREGRVERQDDLSVRFVPMVHGKDPEPSDPDP
jgi:protein-L-isoaspartate(D-aspartate) O-methyltransferase